MAEVTGAIVDVARLFAVLHDSRRVDEGTDPDHGPRAAEFALSPRGRLVELPDHEFGLLHRDCTGHTQERTHPDVTIRTCRKADRLDLERVGITPQPKSLCTEVARRPATIKRADGRASFGVVPKIVWDEGGSTWGLRGRTKKPVNRDSAPAGAEVKSIRPAISRRAQVRPSRWNRSDEGASSPPRRSCP